MRKPLGTCKVSISTPEKVKTVMHVTNLQSLQRDKGEKTIGKYTSHYDWKG